MKKSLALVLVLGAAVSCKKNDPPPYNTNVKAPLSVEFDNVAGESDLQLNSGVYHNGSGEELSVSKLKYYVSNFIVTNVDNSVYVVPQDSCYFLIDESDESTHEPIINVPEGEYKTVQFTIGVDSLRSVNGPHTGVLETGGDMWDATKGYVFLNMEGASPAATGPIQYHIGGFINLRTITLDLTARGTPKVKAGKETNIHLFVDVLKLFDGPSTVKIAEHPTVMFDDFSTAIANNYVLMFRHDHTEN